MNTEMSMSSVIYGWKEFQYPSFHLCYNKAARADNFIKYYWNRGEWDHFWKMAFESLSIFWDGLHIWEQQQLKVQEMFLKLYSSCFLRDLSFETKWKFQIKYFIEWALMTSEIF